MSRLGLSALVALMLCVPASAEVVTQDYLLPGGESPLRPLPLPDQSARLLNNPATIIPRVTCAASDLMALSIGGQILRIPTNHLVRVTTLTNARGSEGCPDNPLAVVNFSFKIGGQGPIVVVAPNPQPNTFSYKVAQLIANDLCRPSLSGFLECTNPDPTDGTFFIDPAGPVDQFDNPPALMLMKPAVAYSVPYLHPSGLSVITMLPPERMPDVKSVRLITDALTVSMGRYIDRGFYPRTYDPGPWPAIGVAEGAASVIGYQVDGQNWSDRTALQMRTCSEEKTAELQVGAAVFHVPVAHLYGILAPSTARRSGDGHKMIDAAASCSGHPLQVSGFRAAIDGRFIEVLRRGRAVAPDRAAFAEAMVAKATCRSTVEGPRICYDRPSGAQQTVYRVDDPDFPATVVCQTPAGAAPVCDLAAEIDMGFSYRIDLARSGGVGSNWAAEVQVLPKLIRQLDPKPVWPNLKVQATAR